MHILITSLDHYQDRPGGAPRLAYDEARYLAAAGHRVTALAAAEDGAPEVHREGNITWLRYMPRSFSSADPRRALAHDRAAREMLERHVDGQVDVIHGHAPLGYLAACDRFGSHARKVYSVHSPARMEMEITWPGGTFADRLRRRFGLPLITRMERKCLERSSAVASDSDFSKQQLTRIHGPRLGGKIQVIPGWVDLERFRIIEDRDSAKRALGWPVDVPVLFTLRRLVPRMGLDRLIRAVRMVRDRGQSMRLLIGGSGPLREELQQLTKSLGLEDWIQFAGRVSDSELPKMYGACDAFLLPTAALECFGLIALEALACGRPVLATPVAAIPEVLANFESGWLARSADETSLADLIGGFLSGHLPQHSPEHLRARAQQLYSDQDRLRQLTELLIPKPTVTRQGTGELAREQAGSGKGLSVKAPATRILTVVEWYLPAYKAGGTVRSVSNLVAALGQDKFQFHILTSDRDLRDQFPLPGVPIDDWTLVGPAQVLYTANRSFRNLRHRVDEAEPEIIYFNSIFSTFTIRILILRRLGLLPPAAVVVAPRGALMPSALGLKKSKKKVFIALAGLIGLYRNVVWHASTDREKEELERLFAKVSLGRGGQVQLASPVPAPSGTLRGICQGEEELVLEKRPGRVSFVFMSRVSREKNLGAAIEWLSRIAGDVTFDIYGPVDNAGYWEECQKSIAGAPANIKIRYLGHVPAAESQRKFCEYHFFLFPTLGESFGHVINESLTAGCPVIVSDQTPWLDLEETKIGWSLPLQDEDRWRRVLQDCVDMDATSYREMSHGAMRYMQERLNSSKSRIEHLNLFECALARQM